ncbi:hypothetical protein EGT07_03240 [Herbaspirillum sp. HC18]|nr:hypothetical protein EGT07_03240 [Herbaspirillum sp. HC18]
MSAVIHAIEQTEVALAAGEGPGTLKQLESDIASIYLARLEGLFDHEALGLHAGDPKEGSFLARIGRPEFWTCALCKKDQSRSSAAADFYLHNLFPEHAAMTFREYCRVWGQSFYAARYDVDSARDMLLLFLDQNLRYLKQLFILEQPHNQDLVPEAQALKRSLEAPANASLFVGDRFAHWVLDEWLPFNLRYVCCRAFLGAGETPAQECVCGTLDGASVTWN